MRSKNKLWTLVPLVLAGCLLLMACPQSTDDPDPEPKPPAPTTNDIVRLGVVAFGGDTVPFTEDGKPNGPKFSGDTGKIKKFLESPGTAEGGSALCYAVSEGVKLLADKVGEDADYGKGYVVIFSDGVDNRSSALYGGDEPVSQAQVFDVALGDLEESGLTSYVFGVSPIRGQAPAAVESLRTLTVNGGEYQTFSTVSQAGLVAEGIVSKAMIDGQTWTLSVLEANYTADYPLYLELTVKARPFRNSPKSQEVYTTLRGRLTSGAEPALVPGYDSQGWISLETDEDGILAGEVKDSRISIPLTGIRLVKEGVPYLITAVEAKVSNDGVQYAPDSEITEIVKDIADTGKVGVVLVVDASGSLSDSAERIQKAVGEFVDALTSVK